MPAGQSKYRRAVNNGEAMARRTSKDNRDNDTKGFASGKGSRPAGSVSFDMAHDAMKRRMTVKRPPVELYKGR